MLPPTDDSPYLGSVVAKVKPATRNIPSYAWLQNLAGDVGLRYEAGGSLGAIFAPLRVGRDLDKHLDTLDPKPEAPSEIRGLYNPIAAKGGGLKLETRIPPRGPCPTHQLFLASCLTSSTFGLGGPWRPWLLSV